MKDIVYLKGDATEPVGEDRKIICHICNDIGKWGKGFVLALSKKWKEPEKRFKEWYERDIQTKAGVVEFKGELKLGEVQFVDVGEGIVVANMVAQHGIYPKKGVPPIRYNALYKCLLSVRNHASCYKYSVHMPRIGAGLAGGDWNEIEKIIKMTLLQVHIPVTVYDLK